MSLADAIRPLRIPAALLLFLGLALADPVARSADADRQPGDTARGKALYYAHGCYGCHGYTGETGARDLVGTGSPLVADEDTFRLFLRLRADQAPELPSTRMPNFPAETLDDADVRDLYAFVRSFRANAPKLEDIPTLRRILEIASRQPAREARSRGVIVTPPVTAADPDA